MKKLFDRFMGRYGLWVAAVALAIIFVLLLNPHPSDSFGSLSTWEYTAPFLLIALFSVLFYLKLRREKSNDKDIVESGE